MECQLTTLNIYAKVYLRIYSREEKNGNKESKQKHEDMIDVQYVLHEAIVNLRDKYSAASRMLTTKQEINREINMSKCL